MGFIPYFAGNVFTIPSPDSGSIPFVPNVSVVLKFLQGKIGISESFYKDLLNTNLETIPNINTKPVASVSGAKNGPILESGGPSFGNEQPPSKNKALLNAQSSFMSNSVTPPGVGLEAIEQLIIKLFGEGFKPIMEMVLIILELLKVIEDVICRLLGFVNPAYIPWSLNACNIQLDLVKSAMNQPQGPYIPDTDIIQKKINDAINLSNNAEAVASSLSSNPNLTDSQRETLSQLEQLVDCAKCDVEVLKKQMDVIKCNLENKPVADKVFPDFEGFGNNAGLTSTAADIVAYRPIKKAFYLGYYDRNGNRVDPPAWIRNSTKWIGQFDFLSSDTNTGHDQFRRIYKHHLNNAASRVGIDPKPYVPFSNISPQKPTDGNSIATAQTKTVGTTTTNPDEDCGCPPEVAYSDISNAMDKYLTQSNETGYKWIPVAKNTIDMTSQINDIKNTSNNFDFVKQASDNLDNYDFNIRNDKDEVIDTIWNLAYNNPDASQLGHDSPLGLPDSLKHKIMETYDIDPEMVGRIRAIRINNFPALPPGKQNLILDSSDCNAFVWNNTVTFYNRGTSYSIGTNNTIITNKDDTIKITHSDSSLVVNTLLLINSILTRVTINTGTDITLYPYGTITGGKMTSLSGISLQSLSILPNFRVIFNGRIVLTPTTSVNGDPTGSIRFKSFNSYTGLIPTRTAWSFAVLPPTNWNTMANPKIGTLFPGNIPEDPDVQLFLKKNENTKTAPKYDTNNKPFEIKQGVDQRDIGYLTELYYLSLGYNVVPNGEVENGLRNIDISTIPTHYWLFEIIPFDNTPVIPSDSTQSNNLAGKNINTRQQDVKDKFGSEVRDKGPYIYTQIPYFFTVIPVFFMGAVGIIIGKLVPLIMKILEIILNPSKIGELLGAIVQKKLGENVTLFAPDLTTNSSKVQAYSFLAAQNSSGTTGFGSFGGRPIINTVIDGLALLVIPGFISFGFKVDKGQLTFVVQRASDCKVDEPIIQLALSMITLPFQMMINIFKGVFDFLSAIAQPWKLPKAIIDFFSFKWLFGTIAPTNQLELLGISFKTPVVPKTDDEIINNQNLHDSFSADFNQLVGLITNCINNPNTANIDAIRYANMVDEVATLCDCLSSNNLKDLSKVFPDEIKSFIDGNKSVLAQSIINTCACTNDIATMRSQEVIGTILVACGINDLPPVLGNGTVGPSTSGKLIDRNGMVISDPIPTKTNVNTSENTIPNEINPYDRNGCAPTIPNTLHYLKQFSVPPLYPPKFDLTIQQIMGMTIEDLKIANPSQLAFINEKTSVGQIFALLNPQLIDLSSFIAAPFMSNLPKVTPQELATMIFIPIEILDSILKLFDGIINGIIAFVMGLFGLDGLFPIPKIKLHCLIPKFSLEFGGETGIKVVTTPRCEDTNSGLVFLPNRDGVSEIFKLGTDGRYTGMDISSFDGLPSLSDGLYTGTSAVTNFLNQVPEAKPVAAACGCDI